MPHQSIGELREDGQVPREVFINHDPPAPLQEGHKANLLPDNFGHFSYCSAAVEIPEFRSASEIKELLRGRITLMPKAHSDQLGIRMSAESDLSLPGPKPNLGPNKRQGEHNSSIW